MVPTCIERVLSKLLSELHEITLGKGDLVFETSLFGMCTSLENLVVVVVETDDVHASELDDLTGRATDTAANIQHAHVVLELHLVGEVVLVAGKGLQERFPRGETAEVEGLRPGFFVEVGGEVVVAGFQEGGRVVSDGYGRNR